MKKIAVLQSNYIPWKGYFDIIHDVDMFIFYDDLQYTKNDWRNRNKVKTPQGIVWLTIPVGTSKDRLICEVILNDAKWQRKHWQTLKNNYIKAPYYARYQSFFEDIYCGRQWGSLSELNQHLIKTISQDLLGINTQFADSRDYSPEGKKLDRLVSIVSQAGAARYVSGPAAKDYIQESAFSDIGIEVLWKSYSSYPEYPQIFPPFTHGVSILDLLFHTGPEASWYIWGWRDQLVGN